MWRAVGARGRSASSGWASLRRGTASASPPDATSGDSFHKGCSEKNRPRTCPGAGAFAERVAPRHEPSVKHRGGTDAISEQQAVTRQDCMSVFKLETIFFLSFLYRWKRFPKAKDLGRGFPSASRRSSGLKQHAAWQRAQGRAQSPFSPPAQAGKLHFQLVSINIKTFSVPKS